MNDRLDPGRVLLERVGDELEDALERARAGRRPVWTGGEVRLRERPDLLERWRALEVAGQTRFLALGPDPDCARLWAGESGEVLRAGSLREIAPALRERLAALTHDGVDAPVGGGAAFEAREPELRAAEWQRFGGARFWVPRLRCELDAGGARLAWTLAVAPDADPEALARELRAQTRALFGKAPPASARPGQLRGSPRGRLEARFGERAAAVVDELKRGLAHKAVLTDRECFELEAPLPAAPLLAELRRRHPDARVFAIGLGRSTFLGATPERMLGVEAGRVRASALAGTAAAGLDDTAARAALLGSAKERSEHAYVVAAIRDALRPVTRDLHAPDTPELRVAGRARHLHSELTARLDGRADAIELATRLHPTPAVGGTPRREALALLARHEGFDRGWYTGPVGSFEPSGDADLWVALRCGLLAPDTLRCYAGAGLVAASQPEREAAETRLKIDALRGAVEALCAPRT